MNPDWYDMLRPSKLPAFANEFGENGNFWASVRQTRFGVRSWVPTDLGEIRTEFEFDLAGVGADAGETTFHLRQAWGSLGPFLAGQTYSVFMDIDVLPKILEYWGPNGMVFYRNIQLRWTPIPGDQRLLFALERPGANGDSGEFAGRIELQGVQGRFPYPDFTAQYHYGEVLGARAAGRHRPLHRLDGHVPGRVRPVGAHDRLGTEPELGRQALEDGHAAARGLVRAGHRDVHARRSGRRRGGEPRSDPLRPIVGEALPVFGMSAFYDFQWSERFRSAIGYSRLDVENSDDQLPAAFKSGQYALANLLFSPVKDVMTGLEFQWGRRANFSDGFQVDDYRIQFSARYDFSFRLGGDR